MIHYDNEFINASVVTFGDDEKFCMDDYGIEVIFVVNYWKYGLLLTFMQ